MVGGELFRFRRPESVACKPIQLFSCCFGIHFSHLILVHSENLSKTLEDMYINVCN